mgnify:CR=1 FL=1
MGTKAKHMDCDGVIQKASQLASKGNDMQNALKEAFARIEAMKDGDAWTGFTYDELAETVNLSRSRLNNIIQNVVSILPHDISINGQGFATEGKVTPSVSYQDQVPITLPEITKTNKGNVWDFDEDVTKSNQQTIKSKFSEAKACMDECQSLADQLLESMNSGNGAEKTRALKSAYKRLGEIIDGLANALDQEVQSQTDLFNMGEAALATKDKIVDAAKETADDVIDNFNKASGTGKQIMSDIKSFFIY